MRTDLPLAGLYIHVPFCASKCPYCGFYSVTDRALAGRFVEAVAAEAAMRRERFGPFDTLYVGGGTPSVLDAGALARLRALAGEVAEATVEANPGDLDRARLAEIRAAGFDRLSLGVQSLDDRDLAALGRRHTAAHAARAFEDARAAGFTNVGIDLIRGVPGQSPAAFMAVLDSAVALGPDHVSVYDLTIEDGTPFARRRCDGTLAMPEEDEAADLFLATSARLSAAGYEHYEVSNFARGSAFRALHNARYWSRGPYLGLGPSAHSFDGRRRWWNPRSVTDWLAAIDAGRDPAEGEETLTDEQARIEAIQLGLRTSDGVDASLVRDDRRLAALARAGLVEVTGGRVRPTTRGMLAADRLAVELA